MCRCCSASGSPAGLGALGDANPRLRLRACRGLFSGAASAADVLR